MSYVLTASELDDTAAWSVETFGPGKRTKGVIAHLRKELVEVEEAAEAVERAWGAQVEHDEARAELLGECADVVILAFDLAARQGFEAHETIEAVKAKWAKNRAREWPDWRQFSEDEAIEHVRPATLPASFPELIHDGDDFNRNPVARLVDPEEPVMAPRSFGFLNADGEDQSSNTVEQAAQVERWRSGDRYREDPPTPDEYL